MAKAGPSAFAIEVQAPDISAYAKGSALAGESIPYLHHFDSGTAGPHVWVQALTHGNEICGAWALDWLMREGFRPKIGRLSVVFANVEAFARYDPSNPDLSRYVDEDFNRVWSDEVIRGTRNTIETRRARQLVHGVDSADFLLDIHSMHDPCRPIMVCGTTEKGVDFARQIGVPGDLLTDTGHPAGLRMIERGGFADPRSKRKAALIECGQHWEARSVLVARDCLLRFLAVTGIADSNWVQERLMAIGLEKPKHQQWVAVTEAVVAQSADFKFAQSWRGLQVIPEEGTLIASDGSKQWRTPYPNCVTVMPSLAHLKPGTTMVRLGRIKS
jgi:predicted deacylase